MRPVVLCFSGLDPSGGAGLQADIEAVAALDTHAAVVCTALTIQDSNKVHGFQPVDCELIRQQAEVVLADLPVAAIKLGMLGSPELVATIDRVMRAYPAIPVVLDPVLAANSGGGLAQDGLIQAITQLFARAAIITPNSLEARWLTGEDDLDLAVAKLTELGAEYVLLKGGHEPGETLINRLYRNGELVATSECPRLDGEFHGSGCTLASAIAAGIAKGLTVEQAVLEAEAYIFKALQAADRPRAQGQFIPRRVGI